MAFPGKGVVEMEKNVVEVEKNRRGSFVWYFFVVCCQAGKGSSVMISSRDMGLISLDQSVNFMIARQIIEEHRFHADTEDSKIRITGRVHLVLCRAT